MNTAVSTPQDSLQEAHTRVLEELKKVPLEHERFEGKNVEERLQLQKELLRGRQVRDSIKESVQFLKDETWIPAREIAEKLLKLPEDLVPLVRTVDGVIVSGRFEREYKKVDVKFLTPEGVEKMKEALELPQDAKQLLEIPVSPKDIGVTAHKDAVITYSLAASPTDRESLMRELVESETQYAWASQHSEHRTTAEKSFAYATSFLKGVFTSVCPYLAAATYGIFQGAAALHRANPENGGFILVGIIGAGFGIASLFHISDLYSNVRNRLDDVSRNS